MNNVEIKKILGIVIAVLIIVLIISPSSRPRGLGGAPSGLYATVATSSQSTIGTSAEVLFATSTNCAARVISTSASAIMLTFSDYNGQIPTGSNGFLQAASTTVSYDAGIYGCNLVRGISFVAGPVNLAEMR